jgi:hypothetical protein
VDDAQNRTPYSEFYTQLVARLDKNMIDYKNLLLGYGKNEIIEICRMLMKRSTRMSGNRIGSATAL